MNPTANDRVIGPMPLKCLFRTPSAISNYLQNICDMADIIVFDEVIRGNVENLFTLKSNGKYALLYSASEIQFLPTEEVPEIPFVKNNSGLDVLNARPSIEETLHYISQKKFQNKSLSALLLDQKFVLGMGNYLRSEVLFLAKIHPDKTIGELSAQKKKALAKYINLVMIQAYEHKGVTNDLARAEKMKNRKFFFEDYRFWVFNRENAPCYNCQSIIMRIEKNARRLYFCKKCQRK